MKDMLEQLADRRSQARLGGALIPGLALRLLAWGALSASPRGPTLLEDGTDEAAAKAGGTPWKVPDPGRRGTLSAPGLCRPGLSAASTRGSFQPRGRHLSRATARLGFGALSPNPPRAMPPHDQTPPEVPLCRAGREM